jgi:hypothetical protein
MPALGESFDDSTAADFRRAVERRLPNRLDGKVTASDLLRGHVLLSPNSEVEVECGAVAQGAHAAGVRFSAARRKSRPTNFLAPKSDKEGETKVWASRPNRHAGRVRYHSYFGVRA